MPELVTPVRVFKTEPTGTPIGTVCVCTRDHITAQTFMSAMHTDWSFTETRGPISWVAIQGSILTMQRNQALRQMDGDWILFIDDDMVWAPDAVGKLIESWEETQAQFDEPVLMGALCFRRQDPYDPTLYMRDSRTTGRYRMMETWDTEIVEVDATGLAFLLIPKAAIVRATAGAFVPEKETRIMYEPLSIFEWTGNMGEDLRFCQLMKEAGCRIMVDTRIPIGHVAEHQVGYGNFLASLARRTPDEEDMVRQINDKHGMPTMTAQEAKERLGW